jgi:hypothetical protein
MRSELIASLLVIAILAGAGVGYLSGNANERITTTTFTYMTTSTLSVTTTVPSGSQPSLFYLTNEGYCTGGGAYAPCFGSPAYLFNSCPNLLAGPAAPHTCTYTVTSTFAPHPSYRINITLGVTGETSEPDWANCSWTTAGSAGSYADCVPVINATAFIMGIPSPPPL